MIIIYTCHAHRRTNLQIKVLQMHLNISNRKKKANLQNNIFHIPISATSIRLNYNIILNNGSIICFGKNEKNAEMHILN